MNSGIRSLVLAARQHGVELGVERLLHENALQEESDVDIATLLTIANANRLTAKSISSSWDEISKLDSAFPVILRFTNNRYVILARWCPSSDGEDCVAILDPLSSDAKLEYINQETLEKVWAGDMVLLKRKVGILNDDNPFSLSWFFREMVDHKLIMLQLLGISFLLHIFGFLPVVYIMTVLDKVVNYEAHSTLIVIAAGIVVAQLFNGVFAYLRKYLILFFVSKVEVKLNVQAFSSLMGQSVGYFHQNSPTSLIKTVQQVIKIKQFLVSKLFGTVLDATGLFVFVPILLLYSPQLFGVVLVFALLIGLNNVFSTKRQKGVMQQVGRHETQKQSILMNSITGIETVKTLSLESILKKSWEEYSSSSTLANLELGKMSEKSAQVSATLQQLMTVTVIFVGVLLVFDEQLTPGVLIGVNMLAGKVTGPLVQLVTMSVDFDRFNSAIEGLGSVINRKGEARGQGISPTLRGGIEFNDVSLTYNEGHKVLSNLNFEIQPRQRIALVGPSGCGKSSLMRLMQGLLRPDDGTISFEGNEIRTIDPRHLRLNVTLVGKENTFFAETIRENILRPMPTASMERVIWATKMVGLHDEIKEFADGYETQLEEGAANLSSGQRQKLALARALIRNPKILMIDDALSGLSLDDEHSIRKNMDEISSGRTVIFATHQLSQIKDSDQILVLNKNGELFEQGTHEELMNLGGEYADLWSKECALRGGTS
ncbi:peptidase domain-containing ABC transporter [Terasakiella sp. SH-1]|uniref:peptidase domain-containing ABC transporter n=1 Tax=Terasakiella sp. SH-1 TaxID=2560057 RepID=UPI001073889F|nr:peptidase domain-containing ABC transporter [Terasakiella sp. SH-1]